MLQVANLLNALLHILRNVSSLGGRLESFKRSTKLYSLLETTYSDTISIITLRNVAVVKTWRNKFYIRDVCSFNIVINYKARVFFSILNLSFWWFNSHSKRELTYCPMIPICFKHLKSYVVDSSMSLFRMNWSFYTLAQYHVSFKV